MGAPVRLQKAVPRSKENAAVERREVNAQRHWACAARRLKCYPRLSALRSLTFGEGAFFFSPASAQTYPSRPIRIVVPLPPGANGDLMPRILAQHLSAKLGQPVVIENRPGAAQNLGAELVYRAEPDGYTLLATPQGPLVISQSFFPKLGFDPSQFVPVTIMAKLPYILVVHPKVPVSKRSRSSSPTPRPIPTSSTTRRPRPAAARISPARC